MIHKERIIDFLIFLILNITFIFAVDAFTDFNQVYALDDYELVFKQGSIGSGNGLFNQIGDLDISSDNNIYVADSRNHRIQKFSLNGPFIAKWGSHGSLQGQFDNPTGIAIDATGTFVYVTDTGNDRIQKFDNNGTFITSWGGHGSKNGLFQEPTGIAIDATGTFVYVTDTGNDRIQKFDNNGNFISTLSKSGTDEGKLNGPTGIEIDKKTEDIIVVDSINDRIQKFDNNGNFISTLSKSGKVKNFNIPYGIAIDSIGNIYVTDKKYNNIQTFSPIKTIIAPYQPKLIEQDDYSDSDEVVFDASLSDLPQSLLIIDDTGSENYVSLRAFLVNGQVKELEEGGDYELDTFELNDWNPAITFHFVENTGFGLIDVKRILIGQIKSYKNAGDALKQSNYWAKIPLNEEIIMPLKNKGENFFIAEIQFGKGISGIYSGVFNLDAYGAKSFSKQDLKNKLDGSDYEIKRNVKFKIDYSIPFWQLTQTLTCQELEGHGFPICN